jgi:glycosyltransferase involved in cell wall biosynthesis
VARDRPLVFTAHDVLPRRTERRVDLWRRIFAAVDRVVVHSDRAAERLAEIGVAPARVAVVPHPLFAGPPGGELTAPSGRTLLFFGLLRGSKGLDLLLRAFPAVLAAAPGTRLVIAGDPLDPIEPLQRLAADLGLTGHVEWRIGYLPDEAVPALMEKATAVVLPYRKIESSGVLATALGHGRPAVVTDVGSLGDTVRTYSAGLVVPAEDVDALAQACIRLLTDEDALSEAFAGTKRALAELTWEAAALAHERLYDEVRAARRAGTPTGSEAGTRI